MIRSEVGAPRGVLTRSDADPRFAHARLAPSPDLAPWIAHYWMVAWDLRGDPPFTAETLPHPTVHVTVDARRAEVGGVHPGAFRRRLTGRAHVFGIKFRPAAFYPVLGAPMAQLTGVRRPVREIFGAPGAAYARAVRPLDDPRACADLAEAFLRGRLPPLSQRVARIRDLVEQLEVDRDLVRVEQVAALAGVDARTLQRLFRTYVGVGPKWVIQRYRLHEAAAQLAAAPRGMADLALRLGYFDQAHFIRDFKSVVGRSPGVR